MQTSFSNQRLLALLIMLCYFQISLFAKSIFYEDRFDESQVCFEEKSEFVFSKSTTLFNEIPKGNNNSLAAQESALVGANMPAGYIKFADLRGVAGNPQFDSLSICGNCDTISIFIVTNSDTVITDNMFTVNLPEGLSYCGAVGSETTIGVSEANVTNPQSPQFFIPDINSGNGVQVWFTVKAECDVVSTLFDPIDDELFIDYRMDYTDPSGNAAFDLFFPPRPYNNAVMIPVLNILSIEDQTLAGAPLAGTLSVPGSYQQKATISQNGLGAFLEEFYLEVDYVDGAHTFVSMEINGVDVTAKVIDDGDKLQVLIDSTDFTTNMDPLTFPNIFEEDEQLMVVVVWDIDFCLDTNVEVEYNAFYSCGGSICRDNTDDTRSSMTPLNGPDYNVSVTWGGIHGTTSICNNRTRTLTYNNNSTNALSEIHDIALEFSTSATNLCNVEDVLINGVSVIGGFGQSPITTFRGALKLDNILTSDPDGVGGLDDLDGDGFYDDLPASSSVAVQFVMGSVCDELADFDAISTGCPRVNCTYRPSVRPIYKIVCQEDYIQNTGFIEAWRIQAHTFFNRGIYDSPDNLNQNDNFTLGYAVDWNNSFRSPNSSCANYSLEFALPLPPGIQVNSATWNGGAVPADSISIVNDTLYINTQSFNRTNLTAQANLVINMTNLICVNDIIDWEPITYLHCNDVLPDCGCSIPVNNTPESTSCRTSASTVRLGCTCPWVNTTKYDVNRISYGYTDKDMSEMVNENTPGIELKNFISCDSFYLCTEGVIRADGYDSLKLHIGQDNSNFMLETITAEFEVVDVSTGMTISGVCGSITKDRTNDQITFQDPFVIRTIYGYEFDLSNCLSQPLDLGDTVRLTGYGTISNNTGTSSLVPDINEAIWSVYDHDPLIMDFAECNAINDPIGIYKYAMHGLGDVEFDNFCEGDFTGLISPENADAFPNEFRNVNALDSIVVCTEGPVDESSFMLQVANSGLMAAVPSRTYVSGINTCYVFAIDTSIYPPICADFSPEGDTLAMFTFDYFRNCSANDGFSTDLGVFYNLHYRQLGNLENDPNCFTNRIDNVSRTTDINVVTSPPPAPEIELTVSPLSQTAVSGNFCFDVRVQNTGGSVAPITWLGLQNLSGDVSFTSVMKDAGAVDLNIMASGDPALNQVLIDIDTMLGQNQFVDLEVCVDAMSCGLDTIRFYAGWECGLLPTDIQIASYGQFSCPPVFKEAVFEILDPQIQLDFLEPVTGEVSYCTATEYLIEIKNVRQGPAFLDSIFVYLPLGDGFQFVPGSFTLDWPSGSTPVSIPDPVPTGVSDLFMGNQYVLTNLSPPLDANQTLPGINLDPNNSRMFLRFEGVPTCGYEEGSIMRFQSKGRNICDETIMSNLNTSPRISLFGIDTFIVNEYLIFAEPSQFSTCADQEIFEINILNEGPFPTSPDELVCLTIPDTIALVPGSFDFFNPVSWNPAVQQDSVGIGINEYCFHMPAGVPVGGVFSFNFEVDVDANTPCGIYPFFIKTLFEQERVCEFFESEAECNLRINTSLNSEFSVNLINSLSATTIDANFSISPCSEDPSQFTYQMEVTNNNFTQDFPSGQASVRLYEDINNNGVLDLGTDVLLLTDFISQIIPAGESVDVTGEFELSLSDFCTNNGYLIELSDNAGCICGSEFQAVQLSVDGLFGTSPNDTIPTCGTFFNLSDSEECDSVGGIYADIAGITNPDPSDEDFFDDQINLSSLTDGANNPLDPSLYFDNVEMYIYIETFGIDYLYAGYDLFGEILQCSPDGILKLTFDISLNSSPGCSLPYTVILDCSGNTINLNSSITKEEIICDMGDTVCVNLFDHIVFEDTDGNSIDPFDANSGFDINNFTSISLFNNLTNAFLLTINTDSISNYADLDYEVCVTDGDSYRIFFNSVACNNVNYFLNFSLGESAPSFTQMLDYPAGICLGDEVEIINSHTGIFEGVSVVSGDMLAIPVCNNFVVCDTITVSPSITTTYKISLADSLGCRNDTIFTIEVRDTESPLIVTVDDNLLCEGSTETAMVCINDPRAATIFTWQLDGVDIPGTAGMTCITATGAGIYSIMATDDLGCPLAGQNVVFEQPSPEPIALLFGDTTFCVSKDTLTIATTIGFSSYNWFQITGGTTTPIATGTNTINFSDLGTHSFYVEVTDLQGCAGISDTITVEGVDCFVDLELDKALFYNGTPAPDTLTPGDTVTYMIIIENRTMLPDTIPLDANGVVVNDDLPAGLTYLSSSSTLGTYDPITGDWNIGFFRNGRIDTLLIDVRLDTATTVYNLAEVTEHEEDDIDSDPDNSGSSPSEDDEADETIAVGVFDLALKKEVLSPGPFQGGDDVTFEITVYNQGSFDASNIVIHDYIPTGLKLNDSNWNETTPQVAEDAIAFLGRGDSTSLFITMRIYSSFSGQLINNAEIVSGDGGIDEDSPLSNTNDGTTNELATNNNLDDDGSGTPGTMDLPSDEDDYDPALIEVECPDPACLPVQVTNGSN